jgi:hypothetical protein
MPDRDIPILKQAKAEYAKQSQDSTSATRAGLSAATPGIAKANRTARARVNE